MKYLGLDVGTRRTGVAYADDSDGILFSLETIRHTSEEELIETVLKLVRTRSIDQVVIGLPLLLSGKDGSQSEYVRDFGEKLEENGCSIRFVDERFSTVSRKDIDPDSSSACSILSIILKS